MSVSSLALTSAQDVVARSYGFMLDLGFDVNACTRTSTALHDAAWHGHLATAQALVERGADPAILDRNFNATPLGWARHGGRDEVAAYLEPLTPSSAPLPA